MTLITTLADSPNRQPTYLAIGTFDGVHRGHQHLLQQMITAAHKADARAAALTFYPHPRQLIQGKTGRFYLMTLQQRQQHLLSLGLDLLISHPFDEEVRHTRAADFIHSLDQHLGLKQLWGHNFGLGYQREGNIPFLQKLSQSYEFNLHILNERLIADDDPISSTRIRQHITNGNITAANHCLGHPYTLTGTVVQGAQRGRTIGFPTANLSVWSQQILPANGVYVTSVHINGQPFRAATNIGTRPTVDGQTHTIEAHILDYDADLYGQEITLEFIKYIRPEQKFDGLDPLINQIQADVNQVRQHPLP